MTHRNRSTRASWTAIAVVAAVFSLAGTAQAANDNRSSGVPGVEVNVGNNASDRGLPGVEMNIGRDGDQDNVDTRRLGADRDARGVPGVEANVGRNASDRGLPGVEMNIGRDGDQNNLGTRRAGQTDDRVAADTGQQRHGSRMPRRDRN